MIAYAQKIGAKLQLIAHDFAFERTQSTWTYRSDDIEFKQLAMPALKGDFQLYNASCVLSAIQSLQNKLPVNVEAISQGLSKVQLRGRFQYIAHAPDVILDVAHNPHAAKSLAINLEQTKSNGQTIAVFAMLADKDIAGVIQAISSQIDAWYVSGIDHVRGASVDKISEAIVEYLPQASIKTFKTVTDAYHQACIDAHENDRIIVAGSFFTVAEVMRGLNGNIQK